MVPFGIILMMAVAVNAYSGGAPLEVCDDMVPKHPVPPQKSELPYTVQVNKNRVKMGENVDITIAGNKDFKGYLLQIRDAQDKAVGSFVIPNTDKYSKTINCHGNTQSSATHKNGESKKNLTLKWAAPRVKGTYTVFATVAEDGGKFWVRKPTARINVA